MDRRGKILAGAFGAVMGYALLAGVVYPQWVKPLLSLDERIAERQKDLDKLLAEDAAVQKARFDYKTLVGRVGSFDAARVDTNVRDRLNQLIEKHKLADAAVTPSRPVEDRKTGLTTSTVSVTATGTLDAAIAFLKDVAELPDLVRAGNVALAPASGARKGTEKDPRVNVRVPLEIWVLPRHPVVGPLKEEDLTQPPTVVRHAALDYSRIAASKFFWDYVPPIPLRATIARPINVEKRTPATLEGGATGGDGEYAFLWTPSDGLSDPTSLRPTVDTSTPGNRTYTLTVTDGTGNSVTASTTVVVREPKPVEVAVKLPDPTPQPVVPKGREPWPDAKNKEIRMALLRTLGNERLDEFMVYDNKSRQVSYHKVGDPFDGGELVYVHQLGGIVKWEDQYYVYPLGATLDRNMDMAAASAYPELQHAGARIRQARTKPPEPPVKSQSPEAQAPAAGASGAEKAAVVTGQTVEEAKGAQSQQGPVEPPMIVEAPDAQAEFGPPGAEPAKTTTTPPKPARGRTTTKPGARKNP